MPITLKINAESPRTVLQETQRDVEKIKTTAKETGVELTKAFGSAAIRSGTVNLREMASSFATVKTAAEQANERVRASIGYFERMRQTVSPLEKNFKAIADQLDHERQVLEQIRGPFDRYTQQVKTLDNLMKQGKITAREYTEELKKAGQEAKLPTSKGGFFSSMGSAATQGMSVGGASGIGASLGGQLAGIAGPAAAAGFALHTITEELERWAEHDRTIMNATNQLLRFYNTTEEAAGAVGEFVHESELLGVSVSEQIEAYDAVGDASEHLQKTHGQLMDMTRTLSMEMIHQGKSMGDVGRVMETLQFGMAKGSLETRELRSIVKDFPEVADIFAASIGKTRGEMLKMAENGQIGTREIAKMMHGLEDGSSVAKVFAERQLDIKQVMDQQHVSFVEAMNIVIKHKETVLAATKALDPYEKKLREINERLNDVTLSMDDFDKKLDKAQLKYWMDTFDAQHQKNLKAVKDGVEAHNQAVQKYKGIVDSILGPQRDFELRQSVINSLFTQGRISVEQYTKALRDLAKSSDTDQAKWLGILTSAQGGRAAMASELTGDAAWQRAHEGFGFDMGLPDQVSNKVELGPELNALLEAQKEKEKALFEMRQNYTKAWIDEMEKAKKANEEVTNKMADGFGKLGESIVQMSLDGKSSINDMLRSIAAQMIAFMVSAGVRGFINMVQGNSFTTGFSGIKLPGFASGGLIRPGGSGGTDSQVVAFRKSPDETVRVTTPSQEGALQAAVRGGRGNGDTTIINSFDPAAVVGTFLRSAEGERIVTNIVLRQSTAIRGRTDGR